MTNNENQATTQSAAQLRASKVNMVLDLIQSRIGRMPIVLPLELHELTEDTMVRVMVSTHLHVLHAAFNSRYDDGRDTFEALRESITRHIERKGVKAATDNLMSRTVGASTCRTGWLLFPLTTETGSEKLIS